MPKKDGNGETISGALAATALILVLAFIMLTWTVVNVKGIVELDLWVSGNVASLRTPFITYLSVQINDYFIQIGIASIAILIGILLARKEKYLALLAILSSITALSLDYLIKVLLQRGRPDTALIHLSNSSYPSGHALLATVLFLLLIITFKNSITSTPKRRFFIGLNLALLVLISLSRVYLNVHWLSDIMASWAAGIFIVALWMLVLKMKLYKNSHPESAPHLAQ